MSTTTKYKYLASVLQRIFATHSESTLVSVPAELGYRSHHTVARWVSGEALPDLHRLIALANVLGWPLDDLILPWLADQAPEHATRFLILGGQLIGLNAARNLLSGEGPGSENFWVTMVDAPKTAAEVALELKEVPMGSYRDNRRLRGIAGFKKS